MTRPASTILAVLAVASLAGPAAGQLRPLEPAPWALFEPGRAVVASAGVGVHEDQRAALAGTEGRLLELGNFQAGWRSGRIAVEVAGTALRRFEDARTFAPPAEEVDGAAGPGRADAGDVRVSTSVLLTSPDAPAAALLRFGTRLPTTDDAVGLDRDRTDFFALLGGRLRREGLRLAGEAGIGIFGTRNPRHEQSDALVYSLSAEYALGAVVPGVQLLGHADAFDDWTPRGNEDLSEARAGVRIGSRYWVQAQWVTGLSSHSPRAGLLVAAGLSR